MGWSRFLHRGHWDDERARELQDYLAHEIDDNIARGMTPDDAAHAAHRKLGNVTQIREDIYEMNTLRFIETIWQDLRYGFRLILRNPTFAAVAILTLALGTGANAAIFQLVNAVRLRALPVERPQELASIVINTNDKGRVGRFMSRRPFFSEPLWQAIRSQQQAFSSVFAWGITSWNIATDGEYRPAQGLYVSGNFFQALGVSRADGPRVHRRGRRERMRHSRRRADPRLLAVALRRKSERCRSADHARRTPIRHRRDHAAGIFRRRGRPRVRRRRPALRRADVPRGHVRHRQGRTSGSSTSWGGSSPAGPSSAPTRSWRSISAGIFQSTVPPRYNAGNGEELHRVQAHRERRRRPASRD